MAAMPIIAPQFFDLKMELIHFTLTGAMLLVVGILTGRLTELRTRLKQQREELQAAVERIRVLATTDVLTALPNRCCMAEVLQHHEKRRATMYGNACIALLDIDWFKKINDRFGHDAGDTVLKQFAQLGRRELRENDVLARWGGEEFLLYLPSTSLAAAHCVVERLRRRLESATLQVDGQQITVTLSAGLVELQPGEPVNDGLRRADKLLYRAKENGRNQVVAEQDQAEAGCTSERRTA